MKIEPNKITKVIEQNYTHLMPDFFKMQTEYLASLNMIYNDLDASLVAMVLTSQFYKNIIKNNNGSDNYSVKHFYRVNNFQIPISVYKIKDIASLLNLPRETVRRKVLHLNKIKLLDYRKNGISVGSEYKIVFNEFVSGTIKNMSSLIKKWETDGSLKNLLELKKNL